MAERKVLIRYYPPDFDPVKLREKARQVKKKRPREERKKQNKIMNVRFMFPFTMCCGTCREFIYIGTKFNSRVERVAHEDYLGLPIWRFYAKCPHCRSDISFKTDPKNTEYILEHGGTRTHDPGKDRALAETAVKEQQEAEIAGDAMKALEQKRYNAANELSALEQLEELRDINKRLLLRESTVDAAIEWLQKGGVSDSAGNSSSSINTNRQHLPSVTSSRNTLSSSSAASSSSVLSSSKSTSRNEAEFEEFDEDELAELAVARELISKRQIAQRFGSDSEHENG